MPKRRETYVTRVWAPGLHTAVSPTLLKEGQATIADNVDLRIPGVIRRRVGWKSVEASLPSPTIGAYTDVVGLLPYDLGVSARQSLPGPPSTNYNGLLAVAGLDVYHSDPALADGGPPQDSGDPWFKVGTLSLRPGDALPLNQNVVRPMFATLENKVFITKSYGGIGGYSGGAIAGKIDSWDTVTFDQDIGGGSPEASIITTYSGNLVVAGINGDPSRIMWSGIAGMGGTGSWPASNFLDLEPGDNDLIMGLGTLQNMMLVVKHRSIWRITGQLPDDAAVDAGTVRAEKVGGTQHGCFGPRTLVNTGHLIIWLSDNGVYSFNGQEVEELTGPIRDLFIDKGKQDYWLSGDSMNATAYFDQERQAYVLFMPSGSVDSVDCVEILLDSGTIVTWSGSLATAKSHGRFKDQDWYGFAGGVIGQRDATVLDPNHLTDNGAPIAWRYRTGVLELGPRGERKVARTGHILAGRTNEQITVQMRSDFDASDTKGRSVPNLNPVGDHDLITAKINLTNVGRNLQLDISGDGSDTETIPEVYEVTVDIDRKSN